MFSKILIANRGEIACRVIQTARKLGVKTVAVYSDVDAHALHVRQADEAVRLGPAPVAESYLRGDLIVQAALDRGAEAIHPGYGFLSENPDFVERVEAAGLTFIGPSAKAIRAMGLKDAAKVLMEEAGVPVVPGYHGADQDAEYLARQAELIGYPVLIKAVAGGGGKGMRRIGAAGDVAEGLQSAKSEAQTAFGNADVLIEKYITAPRHIEVQVFGDGTDAVHLYERDCSLQRRHQKVIEEAPAPGMTEEVRAAMGDAAVRAAKAIGYKGAGTVEFIVDGSNGLKPDGFWFMEMNTRLQVEHPVTEAITGVDLVEWQLRVCSGEALPMQQADIPLNGHAFEARLYAEDVPAGFLPAIGHLDHLAFPADARIDSGVETGSEISPWYDPMIAKITVHDVDRSRALAKMSHALERTEIAGTVTNLGFLQRLAKDDDFSDARIDTDLIARKGEALVSEVKPKAETLALAALTASGIDLGAKMAGFSLWDDLEQEMILVQSEEDYTIRYHCASGSFIAATPLGAVELTDVYGALWCDGKKLPRSIRHGSKVSVFGEDPITFDIPDPLSRTATGAAENDVKAPMPGLIQDVSVKAGQSVAQGERLLVLEAMKMEHVLKAPRDGIVQSVSVAAGDQVVAGFLMVTLEPQE